MAIHQVGWTWEAGADHALYQRVHELLHEPAFESSGAAALADLPAMTRFPGWVTHRVQSHSSNVTDLVREALTMIPGRFEYQIEGRRKRFGLSDAMITNLTEHTIAGAEHVKKSVRWVLHNDDTTTRRRHDDDILSPCAGSFSATPSWPTARATAFPVIPRLRTSVAKSPPPPERRCLFSFGSLDR